MSDFLDVLSNYDVAGAFWVNIKLAFFAGIFGMILGTVLAVMRISPVRSMQAIGGGYVTLFRNTPLTIIMVVSISVLWSVMGVRLSSDFTENFFRLAVLALTVYHATFFCEALRSGVNTVPVGQAEAARAIGLPFLAAARLVILPQAFRGAIAPLGNTIIALIKNTTVAAAVSVPEVSILMKEMIESNGNYVIPIFMSIAVGFVIIVIPVGLLTTFLSRKLAVGR